MKKSLFLICIVALSAMFAGCKEAQQEAAPVKKEMGLQLYSARKLIGDSAKYAENHVAVLKQIADMGYTQVEAACYGNGKLYGVDPKQFKADCEAVGLEVLSSHTTRALTKEELASGDFTEALKWWDECIAAHKEAGMKYIVTPWSNVPETLKDAKTYCDYMNAVGKKCTEAGIKYGYHNHAHEFQKVEDKVYYDFMLENTDPQFVFFQMDVYWAVRGQVSPVDYFNKYAGRFVLLHIKDHREVGQSGMVGFDAIFNNFAKAGCKEFIVEMEGATSGDDMLGIKESAEYLLKADFVKPSYKN
ncbi:MAG: sugar phosphate isomerase/epimerase [Bacteroidales bacterium]|nr:sugar phosphate isomerase/epimerase [Bacteroidales bacterium]